MHIVARCIFSPFSYSSLGTQLRSWCSWSFLQNYTSLFIDPLEISYQRDKKKRRRWCMVKILWYMCRVTDFTKCELALLRLPAPGLQGTWAKAYGLLLVSQIGCDELVKEDLEPGFLSWKRSIACRKHKATFRKCCQLLRPMDFHTRPVLILELPWYMMERYKTRAKHFAESYLTTGVNRRRETKQLSRPNNHNFDTLCERSCPGRRGS